MRAWGLKDASAGREEELMQALKAGFSYVLRTEGSQLGHRKPSSAPSSCSGHRRSSAQAGCIQR